MNDAIVVVYDASKVALCPAIKKLSHAHAGETWGTVGSRKFFCMRDLKGATVWARQTIESDIFFWKPDKWFKIWFYLVQSANHVNGKQINRGECLTSLAEISQNTGASRDQVDKMLRWAKRATMIATRKTTRGMVITLLKYAKYQDFNNYKSDARSDSPSETEATEKRHESDMIQENAKNVTMEECKPEGAVELVAQPITPAEDTRLFFETPTIQESFLELAVNKGIPHDVAEAEIAKFIRYWTEPNKSGKKQRWEMQPTFEVRRRLVTWFGNVNKRSGFSNNSPSKSLVL